MTFLSLENATFRLDDRLIFPETSWQIGDGEQWAVVGANASGKSLLLRGLSGRLVVSSGRLRHQFLESDPRSRDSIYGVLPHGTIELVSPDLPRRWLAAASPFHQARWHAAETHGPRVSELLTYESVERVNPFCVDADQHGRSAFERCRGQALERLGLAPLLARRLLELSSGEQRQLALARALCRGPRLLLLDDPFTGLDRDFRAQLRAVLAGLVADGVKVLLATRSAGDLPEWVSHVLRLDALRIAGAGPRSAASESVSRVAPARPTGRGDACAAPTAHAADPLVEMRRVRVRYGDKIILDGIDWTVRRGDHWAVVGRNGAGKSTLLSLILGDNPLAYANDVTLFGRRRGSGESIWDLRRRIGWVGPELEAHVPAGTRCLDVVCSGFAGTLGLVAPQQARHTGRAREVLALLGLDSLGGAVMAAIGDAERRLVLIARALVHRPEILVLDEPCQGLDAQHVALVRRAVDLAAAGDVGSVIYVTHEPGELPDCIGHVLALDAGRVARSGARADVTWAEVDSEAVARPQG